MRILFIGDVVGKAGRVAIAQHLPGLVRDWQLDCTIINGENAAGGFGITEAIYNDFLDAGADAVAERIERGEGDQHDVRHHLGRRGDRFENAQPAALECIAVLVAAETQWPRRAGDDR